jgi:hypothetical protein
MKPQPTSRDFYIGTTLVVLLALHGFWRYPPSSGTSFYIAVIASVAITIGFWRRHAWARLAAILTAVFGILGGLPDVSSAQVISILDIGICVLTIYWLNRKSVQEQFVPQATVGKSDEET